MSVCCFLSTIVVFVFGQTQGLSLHFHDYFSIIRQHRCVAVVVAVAVGTDPVSVRNITYLSVSKGIASYAEEKPTDNKLNIRTKSRQTLMNNWGLTNRKQEHLHSPCNTSYLCFFYLFTQPNEQLENKLQPEIRRQPRLVSTLFVSRKTVRHLSFTDFPRPFEAN